MRIHGTFVNFLDLSGNAGIDRGGNESAGFCDHLTHLDLVAHLDDGDGGGTDVHAHRDRNRFGDIHAQNGLVTGFLSVGGVSSVEIRSHGSDTFLFCSGGGQKSAHFP